MKNNKNVKIIRRIMIAAVILVALFCGCFSYVANYSHGTDVAVKAVAKAVESEDYFFFEGAEVAGMEQKGLIFYPGGKVDENAYAPLCLELSELGYDVYLMRMPFHLAVFAPDLADEVVKERSDITSWTLMGHSLGGAMISNYASKHTEQVEELILLGAYCASDISTSDIKVLLLHGSEDKVLNADKFEENRSMLPEGYIDFEIEGGNHAGFGNYGAQKGDGTASISEKEQQQIVIDQLLLLEQ